MYGNVRASEVLAIRNKHCVSQAKMANALGIHVLTVSRWERGVSKPDRWEWQCKEDMEEKMLKGMRKVDKRGRK